MVDGWRDPAEALSRVRALARGSAAVGPHPPGVRAVGSLVLRLRDGIDERAVGADPLADPRAGDYAARDFKRFLTSERMMEPASVHLALASVDHLYRHLGMDRANVRRERLPQTSAQALSREEQRLPLRAAERAE